MTSTQERGTPLVEVVMKPAEQKPAGPSRVRRGLALGFMGAVLLIVASTLGGSMFLPWFSTSADETPKNCELFIEQQVGVALNSLMTTQAVAGLVGFVVFLLVGFLWKSKPVDGPA